MTYNTDTTMRKQIDKILQECNSIYANLGMKNALDLGTKEAAKCKEKELIDQVKGLDEDFYYNNLHIKRGEES